MLRVTMLFIMTWLLTSTDCYGLTSKEKKRFEILIEQVSKASEKKIALLQEKSKPNQEFITHCKSIPLLLRALLYLSQPPESNLPEIYSTIPMNMLKTKFIDDPGGLDQAILFYLNMYDEVGPTDFLAAMIQLFLNANRKKIFKVSSTYFISAMLRGEIVDQIDDGTLEPNEVINKYFEILKTAINSGLLNPSMATLYQDPLWQLYLIALKCSESDKTVAYLKSLQHPDEKTDPKFLEKTRVKSFMVKFLILFHQKKQSIEHFQWFLKQRKIEDVNVANTINEAISCVLTMRLTEDISEKEEEEEVSRTKISTQQQKTPNNTTSSRKRKLPTLEKKHMDDLAQRKKINLEEIPYNLAIKKLEFMNWIIYQQADILQDFLFLVSRGVIPFSYLNITLLDTLPAECPTELNEKAKEKITFIYNKWCQLKASQEGQERSEFISLADISVWTREFLSQWLEHQVIAEKNTEHLDATLLNEPLSALPEPLQRVEVPSDDFCFYHALAQSLPGFGEGLKGARQVFGMITSLATNLIQNHPDVANHFMTERDVPIDEIAAQGHVDTPGVQTWGHTGMLPLISLCFGVSILVTTPASWRQDGTALLYNINGSWELVQNENTQSIIDRVQSLNNAHQQTTIILENINNYHWNRITLQTQGATTAATAAATATATATATDSTQPAAPSEENYKEFIQKSVNWLMIIVSIYTLKINKPS
ncbi:hypothetical protein ACH42_06900 [Endozoicomonas sp. (ex Bugula neritina AB1)]|nr:hypothetical protein ACH42_06900 [Endozoicomonas sp. (ex Bugula neritina AB1)]